MNMRGIEAVSGPQVAMGQSNVYPTVGICLEIRPQRKSVPYSCSSTPLLSALSWYTSLISNGHFITPGAAVHLYVKGCELYEATVKSVDSMSRTVKYTGNPW